MFHHVEPEDGPCLSAIVPASIRANLDKLLPYESYRTTA